MPAPLKAQIIIQLDTDGNLMVNYPQDEVTALGLLEAAKVFVTARRTAAIIEKQQQAEGNRIIPAVALPPGMAGN